MPESGITKHNYLFCQFVNPARGHEGDRCDCFDTPSQRRTTLAKQRLARLRAAREINRASTSNDPESAVTSDPAVTITIPDYMCCDSENNLITSIYGSMNDRAQVPPPHFFAERAILAARNNDIRSLNSTILAHFPGDERTYFSADSYSLEGPAAEENYTNIPVEFLHMLNASGLPITELRLKVGCPVILL